MSWSNRNHLEIFRLSGCPFFWNLVIWKWLMNIFFWEHKYQYSFNILQLEVFENSQIINTFFNLQGDIPIFSFPEFSWMNLSGHLFHDVHLLSDLTRGTQSLTFTIYHTKKLENVGRYSLKVIFTAWRKPCLNKILFGLLCIPLNIPALNRGHWVKFNATTSNKLLMLVRNKSLLKLLPYLISNVEHRSRNNVLTGFFTMWDWIRYGLPPWGSFGSFPTYILLFFDSTEGCRKVR